MAVKPLFFFLAQGPNKRVAFSGVQATVRSANVSFIIYATMCECKYFFEFNVFPMWEWSQIYDFSNVYGIYYSLIFVHHDQISMNNILSDSKVGWSSGWVLEFKVLVPSLIKCALQFESGYLQFEKTTWASDLPYQGLSITDSDQFLVENFEYTQWETQEKKKIYIYIYIY